MLRPRVIAVDGPAGSGKSTVGAAVAAVLDYLFFDTGVMYRAVTWAALERGIAPSDEAAIGALANRLVIDVLPPVSPGQGANRVIADGQDVSEAIRREDVDRNVSVVSAYAAVRTAMSARQRWLGTRYGSGQAEKPGIVMVGRDIGTVIMPDAPVKIYLDASAQERAQRRYDELRRKGKDVPFEQVWADLLHRDELDSGRALSPLRVAGDAVVLDTSGLGIDDVVAAVLRVVMERAGVATDGRGDGKIPDAEVF